MNALQVLQRAVRLLPVTVVPTTVTSADPQTANLLAIMNDVGDDIVSRHDWHTMGATFAFDVAADPHSEPLPDDWDKAFPNASAWRSGSPVTPLSGPCSPDAWHRLLTIPNAGFPGYWRLFDGAMQVIGCAIDEIVSLDYVRNGWVSGSDGKARTEIMKDDDTFLIPERLLWLGAIWRWRSSKGLTYAEEMATFEYELERRIAADRAARPIKTSWPSQRDPSAFAWPGTIVVPN